MIERNFDASLAVLEAGEALCREELPGYYQAFRSVLARARKENDEADRLELESTSEARRRLAVAFVLAIESGLAGLKPALRKRASDALVLALAGPATPLEACFLLGIWSQYQRDGVIYRGQKAQLKKIHELILRSTESSAPELEHESLVRGCLLLEEWKLVTGLAEILRRKFPANPQFPLFLVEAEIARGYRPSGARRVLTLIDTAARLARTSTEPRHLELLERIEQLNSELPGMRLGSYIR
jgi:hypothetical protein